MFSTSTSSPAEYKSCDASAPSAAVANAPEPPLSASSPVIKLAYVVENDRISSVITELIVKRNLFGGEVQCFANGQLAYNQLAAALQAGAGVPDLILLDLDMPLMDGWEFLAALANHSPAASVRVFVLTSSINSDDKTKASNYPAVKGFFIKPLDPASVERMRHLLRQDN